MLRDVVTHPCVQVTSNEERVRHLNTGVGNDIAKHPSSPLHVEQLVYDFFLIFGHLVGQAGATQSEFLNSANAFNLRSEWSDSYIHRLPSMSSN